MIASTPLRWPYWFFLLLPIWRWRVRRPGWRAMLAGATKDQGRLCLAVLSLALPMGPAAGGLCNAGLNLSWMAGLPSALGRGGWRLYPLPSRSRHHRRALIPSSSERISNTTGPAYPERCRL